MNLTIMMGIGQIITCQMTAHVICDYLDILIESRQSTSYLMKMKIVIFALLVIILKIFSIEMCMIVTLTFKIVQSQIKTYQSKAHVISYLMAIAMLVLSVTILEIFAVEMIVTLTITFRLGSE